MIVIISKGAQLIKISPTMNCSYQEDLRHLRLGWQGCPRHVLLRRYHLRPWHEHHQEDLRWSWPAGELSQAQFDSLVLHLKILVTYRRAGR